MSGWTFVPLPPKGQLDLARAVWFVLHRLESKHGEDVRTRTSVFWEDDEQFGSATIDCKAVRKRTLKISELDPICFENWLSERVSEWLAE